MPTFHCSIINPALEDFEKPDMFSFSIEGLPLPHVVEILTTRNLLVEELESITTRQEVVALRIFNAHAFAVDNPLVHRGIGDNFALVAGYSNEYVRPISSSVVITMQASSIERREAEIVPLPDGLGETKEGGERL